ncbi:MAG: hydrogenase expression/formation protein [Acidihalobacter sp.]|uniref:hydrogenase expression/formation protein n=1 Tax=Acidihalobacter sp. TaxID=1872108 RepID=UPI00307D52E1
MKPLNIPIVALGPGSQTGSDDEELIYPDLPKEMNTYLPPPLPEPEELARAPQALETLQRIFEHLENSRTDTTARFIDVSGLDGPQRELLNQVLGEGEVSIRLHGEDEWLIQESVFAGVWRVSHPASKLDRIEIGSIPTAVLEHGLVGAAPALAVPDQAPPDGVINARMLLVELAGKQATYRSGAQPHVINLSLLPHTAEDLGYLETTLGQGHTVILSRGYGNCRITATGVAHIWWVQYFNSVDALILNTLEVVDVPSAALAAREDLEDTAVRLREVLEAMQ